MTPEPLDPPWLVILNLQPEDVEGLQTKGTEMEWTKEKIKKLRDDLLLSQEKFGERVGVSFQTVYRWEKGESKPSFLAQEKLTLLERKANAKNPK